MTAMLGGALQEFGQTTDAARAWKEEFDEVLVSLAADGQLQAPWEQVREIIKLRILRNIRVQVQALAPPDGPPFVDPATKDSVEDYEERITEAMDSFAFAPFTIQRLSELALRPDQHHSTLWKYLHALEKVLLVTSYAANAMSTSTSPAQSAEPGWALEVQMVQALPSGSGSASASAVDTATAAAVAAGVATVRPAAIPAAATTTPLDTDAMHADAHENGLLDGASDALGHGANSDNAQHPDSSSLSDDPMQTD
ncbi:PPP4R2-domain-containing protein [Entophlyctis helioformis]|nr:PPP4R2-domain-containing protein [Entophlyctis helioformis]